MSKLTLSLEQTQKLENKILITICEGVKKGGALLTQGIVAIALPGIFGGYRKENDISGRNYH